eukprot:9016219-Pyramimonas_sp.AAC.1
MRLTVPDCASMRHNTSQRVTTRHNACIVRAYSPAPCRRALCRWGRTRRGSPEFPPRGGRRRRRGCGGRSCQGWPAARCCSWRPGRSTETWCPRFRGGSPAGSTATPVPAEIELSNL